MSAVTEKYGWVGDHGERTPEPTYVPDLAAEIDDASDHLGSTQRGEFGLTMGVHAAVVLGWVLISQPHLSKSSPHEQPIGTSHLATDADCYAPATEHLWWLLLRLCVIPILPKHDSSGDAERSNPASPTTDKGDKCSIETGADGLPVIRMQGDVITSALVREAEGLIP